MKHLYWALGTAIILHILAVVISGFSRFHWSDLATTIAIVVFFVIIFFSFSGSGLSVASEARANVESRGLHESSNKTKKVLSMWNPLLTGSLVYIIISFSFPYFIS